MARWVKVVGIGLALWTVGIAVAAVLVSAGGGCGDVAPSDFHVCELDRNSTVSGLVMLWFIVALPLGALFLLFRSRRGRCRICGDELGTADRRVCRRCATRLIERAEPR
jgi:hypothetical protein